MGIDILTLAAARAGKGSGGGASKYKQPDWGADMVIVDILPEEKHTAVQAEEGIAIFLLPAAQYSLVGGKVYEIHYNGTSYNCVCHDEKNGTDGGMYCLGNVGMLGYDGVEMTEDPFVIVFNYGKTIEEQGVAAQMIALDGSETVTLSIKGEGVEIHKIPAEYAEHAPVEPFVINPTGQSPSGGYTIDRTWEDIEVALVSGRVVYLIFAGVTYAMSHYEQDNKYIRFIGISANNTNAKTIGIDLFNITERGADGMVASKTTYIIDSRS